MPAKSKYRNHDENKLKEQYDPVVRSLFIIITSIVVFTIAVVELWFWAN